MNKYEWLSEIFRHIHMYIYMYIYYPPEPPKTQPIITEIEFTKMNSLS